MSFNMVPIPVINSQTEVDIPEGEIQQFISDQERNIIENFPDIDYNAPRGFSDELIVYLYTFYKFCSPVERIHPYIFTPLIVVFLGNVFLSTLIFNYQICKETTVICAETLEVLTWGGLSSDLVVTQGWRLVTYGMHHLTFFHIFTNLLTIVMAGYMMEIKYGCIRLFLIFWISVLGGGIFSWWLYGPNVITAGASGGAYGLVFLMFSDIILNWETVKFKWITLIILSSAPIGLFLDEFIGLNVATWAHIGAGISSFWVSFLILPNFYYRKYEWILPVVAAVMVSLQFGLLPGLLYWRDTR